MAEEPARSDASISTVGSVVAEHDAGDRRHVRRISYFMLFRLGLLTFFTVLAGLSSLIAVHETDPVYEITIWSAIGLAFAVTLFFAWRLRTSERLIAIAWGQTAVDIVLAVVVVQLSGGAESGFVFLYLVAILGAAVMGDRSQVWATAVTCGALYVLMSALQVFGIVDATTFDGAVPPVRSLDLGIAAIRTTGAMAAVTVLSAYLNTALSRAVVQVGSLQALNENIVRSLTSGLITVDPRGQVLFANPTAHEILGLDPLVGTRSEDILPGVEEHLGDGGGPDSRFEIALNRADGKTVYLGLSCSPLLDAEGRAIGHVVNFQDVTRVQDLQRKVRRNERLAAVGGLAASVAHEVRNPLTAIAGSAELLAGTTATEDDRRLLEVIQREAERLNHTVSALLDYTSPRPPQWASVDVSALCRDVAAAFRADPANADIEFDLELPESLSATADPSQLSQVLWNLLRNAGEAVEGKGRITLRVAQAHDTLQLSVSDTGPGMDEATVEKVFEPFFSTKDAGSGIGLAVVHRIVEEHGGSVSVKSEPGEGTTFTVELPPRPDVSGLISLDRLG